jgi:hypothetical protein
MLKPHEQPDGQDFATAVIRRTFLRSASSQFLADIATDLRRQGVVATVKRRDTTALFSWLMTMLSYQGISDRAAEQFIAKNGQIGWQEAQAVTTKPACPKLASYWHFEGCNYRKGAETCGRPDLIGHCRLPRQVLRNGRLNQTAASLYLFVRDVADSDLIGWLDGLLADHAHEPAHFRAAALADPLRNIYGVSDKLASMLLSALLLGGGRRRRLWFETGSVFVVVDTLVHNYLQRTGILTALGANHPYGSGCYGPTGCAAIIQRAASQIDAQVFGPDLPSYFPRFVQHAIWRFCAMDGLDVCNGNRVDDRSRCQNWYCQDFTSCRREMLAAERQ